MFLRASHESFFPLQHHWLFWRHNGDIVHNFELSYGKFGIVHDACQAFDEKKKQVVVKKIHDTSSHHTCSTCILFVVKLADTGLATFLESLSQNDKFSYRPPINFVKISSAVITLFDTSSETGRQGKDRWREIVLSIEKFEFTKLNSEILTVVHS